MAFAHTAGTCTDNIVLMQLLQNCCTYLTCILGGHSDSQCQGRQNQGINTNLTTNDGQQVKLQTKKPQQHQAYPEAGHGYAHKSEATHDIVNHAATLYGRVDTGRNCHHHHHNQRSQGKYDSTGKAPHKCFNYRLFNHVREAKIAL